MFSRTCMAKGSGSERRQGTEEVEKCLDKKHLIALRGHFSRLQNDRAF